MVGLDEAEPRAHGPFAADRSDPLPGVMHRLRIVSGFRAAPRFVRTMLASSPASRTRIIKTRRPQVAIIGGGAYGLSLASHLADRNIEHRILPAHRLLDTDRPDRGAALSQILLFRDQHFVAAPRFHIRRLQSATRPGDVRALLHRKFRRIRPLVSGETSRMDRARERCKRSPVEAGLYPNAQQW